MKRLLIALITLTALAATAGEYEVVWDRAAPTSIVNVELTGENLARLGGHAEWLRLYDCNGTVVPWALRHRMETIFGEVRYDAKLLMDTVRHGDGGRLEIDCHISDEQRELPEKVHLTFRTAMRDFEQQVSVHGGAADGTWTVLLTDGFIFESSANLELKNTDVTFDLKGCRRLHIQLGAASMERRAALRQISREWSGEVQTARSEQQSVADQAFKIDRVELWWSSRAGVSEKPRWGEYPAAVENDQSAGNGTASYTVTPAVYPVSGIRLQCAEENFSRGVSVYHVTAGVPRLLVSGPARRFTLGATKDESLLLFEPIEEGQLRVEVANQDNPPLQVTGIATRHPLYSLRFVGSAPMQPCRLTAQPGGAMPRYDTAALLSFGNQSANPIFVRLGEFRGDDIKGPAPSRQGVPRWALIAAVAVAVLAMGAALFSTLRKMPPN